MAFPKDKGDISRKNLESHGIYYDETQYRPPYIIPEHVDAVREILLLFSGTVPSGGWEETLRQEAQQYVSNKKNYEIRPETLLPPDTSLVLIEDYEADLNDRSPEWRAAHENLKSCKKVAKIACSLGPDSEEGWVHFWRSYTFTIASEKAREQPGFHHVLDSWSLEGNCTWMEFPNLHPRDTNLARRTRPKPDLTYAFPILKTFSNDLHGFERDDFTKSFSATSLGTLTQRGIICAPTTGLRNWMKTRDHTSLRSADLSCFPWAVVEFKRESRPRLSLEERCYCQAANASAAAFDLRMQLLTKDFDDAGSTVPPVIAFTCVGHIVKVWLTYSEAAEPRHHNTQVRRMICIWSTSVQLTWGVATLQAIVMNMHTWATRLLKPRIQASVVKALRTPYISPGPQARTPDIDLASSGLFNSPEISVGAASNRMSSTSTSIACLDGDTAPVQLHRKQADVISEPASPLSLRVGKPIRRILTPRTRHRSACPSTGGTTPSLAPTRMTLSDGSVSTDVERCAAVPTASSPRNSTKNTKALVDQADIDSITRSMGASQLDVSAEESSAQHYDTSKTHGGASEDGQYDGQTPESYRRPDNDTETYHSSNSAAQQVGALLHSDQPPTFPPLSPPVTSVLDSSSVRSASPSVDNNASGTSPRRTGPQKQDMLRQAWNVKTKSLTPQHVSQTVPHPHKDVTEARLSSCLRKLVEHKARLLMMLETLESNLEQGVNKPSQSATPDQTRNKAPSNRFGEKARVNTDTANHIRRASASSRSNYTSQKRTSDIERSTRSKEQSNPRRHSNPKVRMLYIGNTDIWDSESKKQRDEVGKDEPDIDDDVFSEDESKRDRHSEESESAFEVDSEVSENGFSQDESEEFASRSGSDSDSDAVERNFSQDETGESGSDSDLVSDVEDDANSTSTDGRNVTEDDVAWVIGLGSLNGHQLAQTPYLRVLFMSRTLDVQFSMIRTTVGAGAMADDRYEWFGEDDLLDDLLKEINDFFPDFLLEKKAFMRHENRKIGIALRRMRYPDADAQFRWRCFRKALAMRSRDVCAALLCSESFNFSEFEWATLENSAKHATEAYYSPTQVKRLLDRNFSEM
ncbi:hypothetical protein CC86DRAFT_461261 [Ophiobolus disseminans]|uniref:Uncharacterized protein n=1 Tax=Ophiobolus disseminans TaxID=1469910 RepID=A0A6A6ZAC8_9PLEO|nr:hypothetical protein CC86DRAFT_461261 [Ophiobolus disseminans]